MGIVFYDGVKATANENRKEAMTWRLMGLRLQWSREADAIMMEMVRLEISSFRRFNAT